MNQRPGTSSAVTKVELKKVDPSQLIAQDAVLSAAAVVKALGPLITQGALRRYGDRAVLVQQSDPGQSLFLVLAGEVRLFARKDTDAVDVGVARKGEVVGEAEVLDGHHVRRSSAVAQGPVDALEFPRAVLLAQGALLPALDAVLRPVHLARASKLDELSDFLNRW